MLGVEQTVVEGFELDETQDMAVAHVRPFTFRSSRCSRCARRCPGYDQGSGRRRWRAPDLGTARVELEAEMPRARCPDHGVPVAAVPWARPSSGFTRDFEQLCAWLVKYMQNNRVAELLRIAWRSVDKIVTRVVEELSGGVDRLAGLSRLGIDEISYRKGHHYLTVVIDHDTGRIVWAGEGRCKETLNAFFDLLGDDRRRKITIVSADAAEWIFMVVKARCPQAKRCMDPFHVAAWATGAVDAVRRRTVNELRHAGRGHAAKELKGTRWALLKNPGNQSGDQRTTVASIKKTNRKLYTAYLLKEQLREVFTVSSDAGKKLLAGWLSWAYRSQIPEFIAITKTVEEQRLAIRNTLEYAVSNARSEAANTHLRQFTRRACGFHSPDALIAKATLTLGGLNITLPGRVT
uniref:Transposase IS204/IS1001/IS1096/IS1165 family protein n=1 Tax=Candidatus Protofrankia californiensis TaxID=1839754 RepID=A0A1W1B808_9ACTN|nr:transposase IS204/IS1001/IS1096/IS1165 family protein [Candidatus Protofrankia californiensis]